jgi:hypothetical protein
LVNTYASRAQRVELDEAWLPVCGWAGYEVSNYGRVRSFKKRAIGRTWVCDFSIEPKILKPCIRNKYPSVLLIDKSRGRKWFSLHVLVLTIFKGPCSNGMQGAHDDGNTLNSKLSNLRWDTPAGNNADKKIHGTRQAGERCASHKLSEKQVVCIRSMRQGGVRAAELAATFNVCRNTITNITTGRTWV